jgi:hypothetical protein
MCDLQLMYRECGAETRDDYLRGIANENGLPIACVRKIADRLGEREDFGALILDLRNPQGAGAMSAALATAREQTARIARLNDLARRAMGVACTAVATVGFRSLSEADQSQVRELSKPTTLSPRTATRTASAISGRSISLAMAAGRPSARARATMSANGFSGSWITTTAN